MEFWMNFWKFIFILTVSVYAVMAVWVTIQGAFDIRSMLRDIRKQHADKTE